MSIPESVIAVLAKAPRIGKVKTRMRPHLSDYQACQLHRWCLRELDEHVLPELMRHHQRVHARFFVTHHDPF